MNKSNLFKLVHRINKIFIFLNKYLPILSFGAMFINLISYFKNNKIFNGLYNIIKVILLFSIIFSVSLILAFSDFNISINNLPSIYYDLLEPYIELTKHLYNDFINYTYNLFNSQFPGAIASGVEELDIEEKIKRGVKAGLKEAAEELIDDLESEANRKFYRNVIIFFSVVVGVGVYLYLSGSATPPDVDPSTGGSIFTVSPSIVSESLPTITPNTPIINNSPLLNNQAVQTLSQYVDQSVSTTLDGITVSKLVETQSIIADNVDDETANMIVEHCQKSIKNITD